MVDNPKIVVGIVGGIACGKSTVSKYLQKKGAEVICADALSHASLLQHEIFAKIAERWPQAAENCKKPDGSWDTSRLRANVAAIVFRNPKELSFLERLLFPVIKERIEQSIKAVKSGIVVLDAPLLFESNCQSLCQEIWYVHMRRKDRMANFRKRYPDSNQFDVSVDFLAREERQLPIEDKMRKSDVIIENKIGLLLNLYDRLEFLWEKLMDKLMRVYRALTV